MKIYAKILLAALSIIALTGCNKEDKVPETAEEFEEFLQDKDRVDEDVYELAKDGYIGVYEDPIQDPYYDGEELILGYGQEFRNMSYEILSGEPSEIGVQPGIDILVVSYEFINNGESACSSAYDYIYNITVNQDKNGDGSYSGEAQTNKAHISGLKEIYPEVAEKIHEEYNKYANNEMVQPGESYEGAAIYLIRKDFEIVIKAGGGYIGTYTIEN